MSKLLIYPNLINCRRIFLKNYKVLSNIGVHDFEHKKKQNVLFNVELFVPITLSTSNSDDINEVVDYDYIRGTIDKLIKKGHTKLQETLCDGIAELLLSHPKVKAVLISTQKPDIYDDCESVGVEIFRFKK
tara:strand:+ start:1091 stop:1483 length:393 start_codon:yes stop_codon:yes gene_type:complete